MTIHYYTKQVYGEDRLYVANEKQSQALCKLTGNKTLTYRAMQGLKELGIELKEVIEGERLEISIEDLPF